MKGTKSRSGTGVKSNAEIASEARDAWESLDEETKMV